MYIPAVSHGLVLLLFTLPRLSVCSYSAILKQFDIQPLPHDDDATVSSLRTGLDDGLECIYPTDCNDVKECGRQKSGAYRVFPFGLGDGFIVYCDMDSAGGGWLVFQRRQDGSMDFFRNWKNYANGFGNLFGEFWLGLEKIHLLTSQRRYELLVNLGSYDNGSRHAQYDRFHISDESQKFQILIGSYTGDAGKVGSHEFAGDSMQYHNGYNFSTFDNDHDNHTTKNCATAYKAGWWFKACYHANLNGQYFTAPQKTDDDPKSASWYHWRNSHKSMQFIEMKLRPYISM